MVDTLTTNYSLTKVSIGGSEDTWGEKLNANFDAIDAAVKAVSDVAYGGVQSADLLTAILAIDGPGSGINADLLDGIEGANFLQTANLLTAILAVDGSGSGINADLLDGLEGAALLQTANNLSDVASAATARSNLGLDEASNADVWAGDNTSKPITPRRLFSASEPVALSSGSSISVDLDTGLNFSLTLAENATLENPTNRKVGQSGVIVVTQDGTGSRTLAYGSHWKFPNGAPTLSTAAGAVDLISYFVVSSTMIAAAWNGDLS